MNKLDLHVAVNAVVKHSFQVTAERFVEKDGNGEVFEELETCMWALQGLSDKRLVDSLELIGVGHWVEKLAAMHKGKL